MPNLAIVTDRAPPVSPKPYYYELDIPVVAYYIHRGTEALRDLVTV